MKPLRIDFVDGRPSLPGELLGHTRATMRWLTMGVLGAALGMLALVGWEVFQAEQERAMVRGLLTAREPQRSQVSAARAQPVLSAAERHAWNDITRQLNTPWGPLLAALEAATPADVALVLIEPDSRQGIVRLQAEAKTLESLLAYVQRLQATEPFGSAVLVKHETNEQDPNRPLRLTINLRLKESAVARQKLDGERR
jgi:hypothetical protein